jgi:hypothetical protein
MIQLYSNWIYLQKHEYGHTQNRETKRFSQTPLGVRGAGVPGETFQFALKSV